MGCLQASDDAMQRAVGGLFGHYNRIAAETKGLGRVVERKSELQCSKKCADIGKKTSSEGRLWLQRDEATESVGSKIEIIEAPGSPRRKTTMRIIGGCGGYPLKKP